MSVCDIRENIIRLLVYVHSKSCEREAEKINIPRNGYGIWVSQGLCRFGDYWWPRSMLPEIPTVIPRRVFLYSSAYTLI